MPGVQNIIVSEAEAGQKLLQFLQRRVGKDVPRAAVMKWIRKGEVRVDKGRKKPFDRVRAGQTVRIPPHYVEPAAAQAALPGLETVYEDDLVVVLNKPAGLAVHGGDGITDSVAARLWDQFSEAAFTPGLAHRLDRDTTGLLVAGKTYESLRELNDAFASGGVGKLYLARVHGRWPHEGTVLVEDRLEKRGSPGRERVETGQGKAAAAEVTALATAADTSLLAIRLLTGRTHQIRVQLASRGHAILGDVKYGRKGDVPPLLLHCFSLTLPLGEGLILAQPPQWPQEHMPDEKAVAAARLLLPDLHQVSGTGIVE